MVGVACNERTLSCGRQSTSGANNLTCGRALNLKKTKQTMILIWSALYHKSTKITFPYSIS